MKEITEIRQGTFARSEEVNKLIRFANALLRITVREGSDSEQPELIVADRKFELITTAGGNISLGGGGGDNFNEETFDVVEDDNTAGQRIFLTKEVT